MADRPLTVLAAGASGLLGSHLARHLIHRGDTVRRLVRHPATSPEEVQWDPGAGVLPAGVLEDVDVVVNLGGAGVGDHRWTPAYRETIRASRVDGTRLLAGALAEEAHRRARAGRPAPRLLQASAVGIYGDRGEEALTEDSALGSDFLANVCRAWEGATAPAQEAGVTVTLLRTGIVLAPGGGAVGPLLPLFKAGLGGPLGGGRQWWPWISLADHVRAQLHLIDSPLTGPVNVSGPNPQRQGEVIRALARSLGRPAFVPVPRLALRVALGPFADDVLASQRMLPSRLLADGFTFLHPRAEDATAWVGARA
ncbi:TIGR01777 family oxidoreductase [Georgenia faecalis]|uniref:TIGR01777 family oxidoreductase n=1 Tax=Georgenia faecalis TaxID=2483799 RepID=UPI000FD6E112|nr:TIGR01777 family oxidoreductase [Georgenia faecalis]